jgi:hypothetical protein
MRHLYWILISPLFAVYMLHLYVFGYIFSQYLSMPVIFICITLEQANLTNFPHEGATSMCSSGIQSSQIPRQKRHITSEVSKFKRDMRYKNQTKNQRRICYLLKTATFVRLRIFGARNIPTYFTYSYTLKPIQSRDSILLTEFHEGIREMGRLFL